MVEASVALGGFSGLVGLIGAGFGAVRAFQSERTDLDKEYSGSIRVAREKLRYRSLDPLEDIVTTVVNFEIDRLREQIDAEHGQTDGGYGESVESDDPGSILAKALDEQNTTGISLNDVIDSDDYGFDTDVDDEGELVRRLKDDIEESVQLRERLDEIPREHTTWQRRARRLYYVSGFGPLLVGVVFALVWVAGSGMTSLPGVSVAMLILVGVVIGLSVWCEEKQKRLNDDLVEILRDVDALVDD